MSEGIRTIIYPVKDIARSKTVFRKLAGREPYADTAYYVGFRIGDQEIGLDPNGHRKGMSGPVDYWHVANIQESLRMLLDTGAQLKQEAQDVGGGRLIASVEDADGNIIGLLQE